MTKYFPKIKSIEIKKLFGEKDLKWDLEDSVNVLVGNNGTGKSTLLEIIRELLSKRQPKFLRSIASVKIRLIGKSEVLYQNNELTPDEFNDLISFLKDLEKNNNRIIGDSITLLEELIKNNKNSKPLLGKFHFSPGTDIRNEQDIAVEYVSTVDMSANYTNLVTRSNGEIENILDDDISRKLSELKSKQKRNKETYLQIKKRINDSLNLFLGDSGKSVSFDKDIVITYKENTIDITSLSSGEKQVIYIFLSVANAYFNRAIILMDEPEISLHLNWQEKLISTIREINPDSQLIIVTHSPAIVMKGWLSYFKDIADITVGSKS